MESGDVRIFEQLGNTSHHIPAIPSEYHSDARANMLPIRARQPKSQQHYILTSIKQMKYVSSTSSKRHAPWPYSTSHDAPPYCLIYLINSSLAAHQLILDPTNRERVTYWNTYAQLKFTQTNYYSSFLFFGRT